MIRILTGLTVGLTSLSIGFFVTTAAWGLTTVLIPAFCLWLIYQGVTDLRA